MNQSTQPRQSRARPASIALEFLGSMNLAITLLVAIAIASVVGTVLQQNQPYQDYIIKFGPFWFEVFNTLGLYDVYGASWFLAILAFLVLSTSVCIWRNTPNMLREMRNFHLNVHYKSLSAFHHTCEWEVEAQPQDLQKALAGWLRGLGYRTRTQNRDGHYVLAAIKGRYSKLGYFFTHIAIVVICIGALFDSGLPLMLREASGQLKAETRDIAAAEVPAVSRLPVSNPSFRGSVRIPEGDSANIVFLQLRDGYLVQPLPFSIEVKDFRIEHYSTGQPKSFESDLVIHDPEEAVPQEKTIAVNHPWIYKGYAIYQASFSDGGTGLTLDAWPLHSADIKPQRIESKVQGSLELETPDGPMMLEFTNFRMFNINPVIDKDGKEQQKNFGPNFTFKLRDVSGQAREYENYMLPVDFNGKMFMLSGMRDTPSEPFRYLHIPVDAKGGVERFMHFHAALFDDKRIRSIIRRTTDQSFGQIELDEPARREEVARSMLGLVAQFRMGGFEAIADRVGERVPRERQEEVLKAYFKVLQTLMGEVYLELMREEGVDLSQGLSDQEAGFFDDSLTAIAALGTYGSPFYLQLREFDFVQASGLQISRAPGKNMVYFGFALLIVGVFLMFYVPNRKLWFWIEQQGGTSRILAAGTGNRHQRDFAHEFGQMCAQLDTRWNSATQEKPDATS
ncbi:cytochrome c biogenesis protein [Thiogranum longum]|uniref:Cytochrome c biogenesis protein n=1 Tax=Thiogranum longum TaxID=1537524 RepID=A0A4R1HA03_9GAMM|nr:cytochrome c biogenesis protein ResB [Thiogranum longum]TCK16950.1 cytochrome c biogenesis protein [Thiogranum longum]